MSRSLITGSTEGTASRMNALSVWIFGASLLFLITILAIRVYRHNHKPAKIKYSFLNLAIDPAKPNLKTYAGGVDYERLANAYAVNGMPDVFQHKVWDALDSTTVPIIQYPFGKYYNPVTTSQTARAFHERYLQSRNPVDERRFLKNVEWLMKNHRKYYFRYQFTYRHVSIPILEKGWISAMAQGEALGTLSVAYHATGEEKYLDCARGVFATLHTNTDSLWCFGVDEKNYYWLEEYPSEDFCHVLNGKLYALWGIWDYYVVTRDPFALTLFKAGIRTVADNYSYWQARTGKWSYYCRHRFAEAGYHQIHLSQLQIYADFFGIPEFREALRRLSAKK